MKIDQSMKFTQKPFNFVNIKSQRFNFKKIEEKNSFSINKSKTLLPFNLEWNDIDSTDVYSIHELFFL